MSNEPPPIPGMGSQPRQDPIRVEPIGYYNPSQFVQRPGILSALAIVSIIVAGLGFLGSCWSIFATTAQSRMLIPGPTTGVTTTTTTTTTTTAGGSAMTVTTTVNGPGAITPSYSTPSRLEPQNRDLAIAVFNGVSPLSEKRQQMLGQLLDATGDDPFPFGENTFTAGKIRGAISLSGQNPGDVSTQYFVTPNGRIEISDDDAVFLPTQGGPIQITRAGIAASAGGRTPITPPPGFTMTIPTINKSTIALIITSEAINLLLTGFLLFIAIRTLQDSLTSRTLYLRYAALKLIAIVLAATGNWLWYQDLYSSLGAATGLRTWMVTLQALLGALISVMLPVAILIVMSTRSIKAYYGARISEIKGAAR